MRSEKEVDEMIAEMIDKARRKGNRNIVQGVAFNWKCPRQMALLKQALMCSVSFSGMAKELIAQQMLGVTNVVPTVNDVQTTTKPSDIGNFLL